ncbi:extracellular solute-binding protein [Tessaracoccus sp. MC1679]|uniref:ABC transporter substrate-binding protein n=1 Tax=Tessaracoccus sp. MC1679 TaxID=2760313 RepID=UPI001602C874|nr:extracellular solute-binding protein [Tessaracoccus sp. MC1679]MBB1516775.1 extracellular solute-binding protein [Tessaracoccus sp. MC1679]
MNSWKKLAAMAVVVPLALTACGGDNGSTGSNGSDGDAGDGKLTVWAWDPAFNIFALEEAEKIYKQENPDFELEVIETPWDDLQTKLTTLAQSQETGELPDIFLMQNNAFQKNVINYPDLFNDYTDTDVDFGEFPEGVVAYSTLDGVNYGLPFDNGTAITALRTDVLEEAGYTVADFTDITWSDFITKGKDVLAKTGQPLLSGLAGQSDLIMMIMQSAGASLFDDEGNPTIVGNEALIASIETYKELVDSGVFVEVNSWDEYIGTFVNSNVAGTINGVWILGSIQSAPDQSGLWGITNLPKLDGVDGATNYSANGGSSWAISSNADKALAADFLNATFAGSNEFYDTILPASGALANWLPAAESDVYSEPQEFFGGEPIFTQVLDFAAQVPSNNTGAYYYEGRDSVSAAMTKIVDGGDMTTALEEAQQAVEFAME